MIVKGEVVDIWCYIESGEHGPSNKLVSRRVRTAATQSGSWIQKAMSISRPGCRPISARDLLVGRMSQQVTATGTLVTEGRTEDVFMKSVR